MGQSSVLLIDELDTDGINRLCRALENAELLPPAPGGLGRPANNAYLLDGLQHPKAKQLIGSHPTGAGLDLQHLKKKELQVLAVHLKASQTGTKAVIIASIIDSVKGEEYIAASPHDMCLVLHTT